MGLLPNIERGGLSPVASNQRQLKCGEMAELAEGARLLSEYRG